MMLSQSCNVGSGQEHRVAKKAYPLRLNEAVLDAMQRWGEG
jgi:hypothetical protein